MTTQETCPHCGAEFDTDWRLFSCGTRQWDSLTGRQLEERSEQCYERELSAKNAEIDRLKQALERHGWHDDTCWYRSKSGCTCGFNDAIRERREGK